MSALRDRIAANQASVTDCMAVASNGDRCLRPDPHGPEDRHERGAHVWGSRDLPKRARWLENIQARELSGWNPL